MVYYDDTNEKQRIMYEPNSMKVWGEEFAHISDHKLVTCKLQLNEMKKVEQEESGQRSERKAKGWKRRDNGDRKFWEGVEKVGNELMSEWIEMKGNSIEDTNSKGYVENILRSY